MPNIDVSAIDTSLLMSRTNPFYTANASTWARSLAAYGGGAKYINQALIKHMNEIPPEYQERLQRACYVNYPRRVATLITQYVLYKRPEREGADPDFVEDFSRTGMRVDEVMRQFSTYLNICGCAWLAVDMPAFDGEKSKADEIAERLRPYCVAMSPLQVRDWCYGADGKLSWVLAAEDRLDNSDPFHAEHVIKVRKLWTRHEAVVITEDTYTGEMKKSVIPHDLGVVPFIRHCEVDGYGLGENHWFEDVVRISDAILNNTSEAQMNVVKQMFGLLVIPEDFLDTVREQQEHDKNGASGDAGTMKPGEPLSYTLARSAALFESADGKGVSRYIQPAGTETAAIRAEIEALRREMYSAVGLAASKDTKMVESAEAKAWDFQNVEAYMATRADILEQCEVEAWKMVNHWMPTVPVPTVSYNRNFAILDLKESVATLLELSGFNQENDPYQREIGKTALTMLNRLRQLPADKVEEILKLIEASTPGSDKAEQQEMIRAMQGAAGGGADGGDIDNRGSDV